MEEAITVEDFKKIEKEMPKIVNENLEIVRPEVTRSEALRRFGRNWGWS
ncbi:Threonyl-tRNA synthetase [Bacillus thuringiensis serovar israelensis ATCC 35646]|nr:Threonyl-tRNA synthetase [Bacillus thuringiensis serovar israelensis ATCC 35646]